MIEHDRPTVSLEHARSSYSLKRFTSSISDGAIAVIDAGSQGLTVTTFGNVFELSTGRQEQHIQSNARNTVVQATTVAEPSGAEVELLPVQGGKMPCAIEFDLQNGCCDRLVFQLSQGEDLKQACGYLKRVWPILRQDCILECLQDCSTQEKRKDSFSDNWDLLNRVDVAMLILTPKGQLARVNNAGKELLQEGNFLKGGNGGVFAASKDENCAFHRAVLDASTLKDQEDLVVFLTSKSGDMRVPVTLSRYYAQGRATNYIVAMLPTPPSSRRVERLVKQMGLTSSEARVAALMQLGLSNREAAEVSGLKPQTLNTYAKRILNKLNVSGRTEMAQLLTWQASGGRSA